MKIPVLPIIFIVGLTFFSGTIFLSRQSQGMVLGESDYNADIVLDMDGFNDLNNSSDVIDFDNYNFPENKDKKIVKEDIKFPIVPERSKESSDEPQLDCNGIVIDSESGKVLFQKDPEKQVSIASITKLASALVFLDQNPVWENFYKIKSSDIIDGGRIYLGVGEEVSLKDLFYLSLVGSANSATKAMVGAMGMTQDEYVEKMNLKTKELGLEKTHFVDPVGISSFNVSTALEIAKLAKIAFSNKDIEGAVGSRYYRVKTKAGREFTVYNTNMLLGKDIDHIKAVGGKTGYINAAGYCFAGKFINDQGIEVVSVVLGTNSISDRFKENLEITRWAYNNYIWK